MTYQNEFDIEFAYRDVKYGATADVTVELSRQDIGPIGYRDHVERFATDSVHVENLRLGRLDTATDFEVIPDELRDVAESKLSEIASERAEEFLADE
jgi:hypothetical protein